MIDSARACLKNAFSRVAGLRTKFIERLTGESRIEAAVLFCFNLAFDNNRIMAYFAIVVKYALCLNLYKI